MELSNYGMFQTRSGLFVNRTARELLFEVNKLTKKKAFVNKFHYFEVNRTYKANVDRQWVFVTRIQRFRDRATLSLMSALFLLRRGESRWTSRWEDLGRLNSIFDISLPGLAGSTREMGRRGVTDGWNQTKVFVSLISSQNIKYSSFQTQVTMATGSKSYSEVGDIKRWKGSNRWKKLTIKHLFSTYLFGKSLCLTLFRTIYPSTCGDLRGTSAGFTPVDLDRQFIDYFSTDICRSLKYSMEERFFWSCGYPGQSDSQERMRLRWKAWREQDLFSTPPTHLVCSSYSPYFAIISWARINFSSLQATQVQIQTTGATTQTFPMAFTTLLAAKAEIQPSSESGWSGCWYICKSIFYVWDIIS